MRKLERRAETNYMSYWTNPLKYQGMPAPASGEMDDVRMLSGQDVVIHQSSRSHSNSPTPLTSQVSHVRTQQQQQHLHHASPHDSTTPTPNFLPAQYSTTTSSGSSGVSYGAFTGGTSTLDAFNYDMDDAFLSPSIPS